MRKQIRNILGFLSLVICCLVFPASVHASGEDGTFTINIAVENKQDYYMPGESIRLSVNLQNMPEGGITNAAIFFSWDTTVFACEESDVTFEDGDYSDVPYTERKYNHNANVPQKISMTGKLNNFMTGDGTLCYLTIPILEDAADGTYTIKLRDGSPVNTATLTKLTAMSVVGDKVSSTAYVTNNGSLALGDPVTIRIGEGSSEPDEPDDPGQDVKKGYTAAFTTASQTAEPTDTVSATVEIGVGTEETTETYNAMQMVLNYDASKLTYNNFTTSDTSIEISDSGTPGTLTVTRYGSDAAIGDAFTLNFTAAENAEGTADISIVSANIDKSENSVNDAPSATVTAGTHTVTFTSLESYDVTLNEEDVTGAATALAGKDYTFTVNKADGYSYTVSAAVNGTDVTSQMSINGNAYTIPGSLVAGPITVTVTKTQIPAAVDVTKDDMVTGNDQATPGEDYNFTIKGEAGKEYIVKAFDKSGNPVAVVMNADGSYTISGTNIPADGLTIQVTEKEPESDLEVTATEYLKLSDTSMWLITATGTLEEGNQGFAYNGAVMFTSSQYGDSNCYLVISSGTQTEVEEAAKAVITQTADTPIEVTYDKDVNRTGRVDINDAQMAYNMYNVTYTEFGTATMQMFLEADVNGDKTVDTADAAMIVAAIK